MKKIKVSEATGLVLDWLVAKAEGWPETGTLSLDSIARNTLVYNDWGRFEPSTNWSDGGPIIDREGISWHCGNKASWHAYAYGSAENFAGPTPLIAAMRCFVASKLGEEVEVPEELLI